MLFSLVKLLVIIYHRLFRDVFLLEIYRFSFDFISPQVSFKEACAQKPLFHDHLVFFSFFCLVNYILFYTNQCVLPFYFSFHRTVGCKLMRLVLTVISGIPSDRKFLLSHLSNATGGGNNIK